MVGNLKQIKQTIDGLRQIGNPQAAFNVMVAQNPNMKKALDYVNSNGGDPKAATEKLLKESGIDLSEVMAMLK